MTPHGRHSCLRLDCFWFTRLSSFRATLGELAGTARYFNRLPTAIRDPVIDRLLNKFDHFTNGGRMGAHAVDAKRPTDGEPANWSSAEQAAFYLGLYGAVRRNCVSDAFHDQIVSQRLTFDLEKRREVPSAFSHRLFGRETKLIAP